MIITNTYLSDPIDLNFNTSVLTTDMYHLNEMMNINKQMYKSTNKKSSEQYEVRIHNSRLSCSLEPFTTMIKVHKIDIAFMK